MKAFIPKESSRVVGSRRDSGVQGQRSIVNVLIPVETRGIDLTVSCPIRNGSNHIRESKSSHFYLILSHSVGLELENVFEFCSKSCDSAREFCLEIGEWSGINRGPEASLEGGVT